MTIFLGEKLGEGRFGAVYEGLVEGVPKFAIKIGSEGVKSKNALLNEDLMLRYLHQDKEASISHIIKRVDVRQSNDQRIGLVLELLGVNLKQYYRSQQSGLSLEKTRQITRQIAKALCFLEEKKMIHWDIKPQNILMSPDGTSVALADFGSAAFSGAVYNPPQLGQTVFYRSPEVVLRIMATEAIDVWSLAAVITEIYCNKIVFYSEKEDEATLIAHHQFRLESSYPKDLVKRATALGQDTFDKSVSEKIMIYQTFSQIIQRSSTIKKEDPSQLMDLLNQMFVYDPEERITPSEILDHPFLAQPLSKEDIELLEAYGLF